MADIFDLFKKIEKKTPTVQGPVTHLIVGLGNPGTQYVNTRHNAGFLALDHIAEKLGTRIERTRFKALTAEVMLGGVHAMLMKPQTFMNLSGEAVREAAAFYHIEPANVIVIYDDINLPVGRLRVRGKGSDGGHNGLKSIIYQLASDEFVRIRMGVGAPKGEHYNLADYVLGKFSKEEIEVLTVTANRVVDAVECIIKNDVATAMNRFNGASK